ncbi:hypothetical protein [Nostoc sp. NIES-3756]|uniref:hypothetical protein n=1 Tax=Nostoc sp. NIES-3756 TaxID=1751286 RepID=UPI0011E02234|nr:hypothetical protein [Nostoc sp. NIES-3756]
MSYPTLANAQTRLQVQIGTGSDDLRGGNTAFINLILVNGDVLAEQILSTGLSSNSTATSLITFSQTVNASQIRSIRIRHDGNPRSGNPFDTYDQWDLRSLRVSLTDGSFRPVSTLYDSARDSSVSGVIRKFNSQLRRIDIPIRAIGTEPDFVITSINPLSTSRIRVVVLNQGVGTGRLTGISCSKIGSFISRPTNITLIRGQSTFIELGFAPTGTVTCSPFGVDSAGNPEVVTANNKFFRSF